MLLSHTDMESTLLSFDSASECIVKPNIITHWYSCAPRLFRLSLEYANITIERSNINEENPFDGLFNLHNNHKWESRVAIQLLDVFYFSFITSGMAFYQ